MTPEQKKAKELVDKFKAIHVATTIATIKQCTLICVEEMLATQNDFYGLVLTPEFRDRVRERVEHLERVKSEIEKL